jgi:hypothetical protein
MPKVKERSKLEGRKEGKEGTDSERCRGWSARN